MEKREQNGNKAQPFPEQYRRKVTSSLQERLGAFLADDEVLAITGELGHGHSYVKCEISRADRHFELALELAVECEANEIANPLDARDRVLDKLDEQLHEFFASERMLRFPPLWVEQDMDGTKVRIRGHVVNPALEAEADALLKAHGFSVDGEEIDERE